MFIIRWLSLGVLLLGPWRYFALGLGGAVAKEACTSPSSYQASSSGVFDQTQNTYYHISAVEKVKGKFYGLKYFKYFLHKVNLDNFETKRVLAFNAPRVSQITSYGRSLKGIIAISYKSDEKCLGKEGQYLALPLNQGQKKGKLTVIKGQGLFRLVSGAGVGYPKIFDIRNRKMIEFDFKTMQRRYKLITIKDHETLLSVNKLGGERIVWYDNHTKNRRGLVYYNKNNGVEKRISFEPSDRFIQDHDRFAVIQTPKDRRDFVNIIELSKKKQTKSARKVYTFKLPYEFDNQWLDVRANLQNQTAVIIGSTKEAKKLYSKAVIYHYRTGAEIGAFKAPLNYYVASAQYSPSGQLIVIEIRHVRSEITKMLATFMVQSKRWVRINIMK